MWSSPCGSPSHLAALLGDRSSQQLMANLGWLWREEGGAAAVPRGSEDKSLGPSFMLMFHLDPTAFPRIQGPEMMHSMPFKVLFRWDLRLLFSALPWDHWIQLFIRMPGWAVEDKSLFQSCDCQDNCGVRLCKEEEALGLETGELV